MRPEPHQTFRELLAQTRDGAVGAFAHSRADLDWLVRESNPDRRHGADRMTRVSFGQREPDGAGFCPPGRAVRAWRAARSLQPAAAESHGRTGTDGGWLDAAGWSKPSTWSRCWIEQLVDQLLRHYAVLLDNALTNPDSALSACALMSDDDAEWLRWVSTGEQFNTPAATLPDAGQPRERRWRPMPSPSFTKGREYSYREIDEESNRLAHWLIEPGHRHRGPRRGLAGQVTRIGHHRAGRSESRRGLPAGRPDLPGGSADVHPG